MFEKNIYFMWFTYIFFRALLVLKAPPAPQVRKEREEPEENLELPVHWDHQERESVFIFTVNCWKSDFFLSRINIKMWFSIQGAPGNRGFPGQDGLAGAKVGPG